MKDYLPILLFVVALLAGNALWKGCIHGDEEGTGEVTCCGRVVTPFFDAMASHTTDAVFALCSRVENGLNRRGEVLRWDTGSATHIVWSCTPLKQVWIWFCIILSAVLSNITSTERITKDAIIGLLYFVFGALAIYGINILRISAITLIIRTHPDWFEIFHSYIFKYLFYGLMFAGWLLFPKISHFYLHISKFFRNFASELNLKYNATERKL